MKWEIFHRTHYDYAAPVRESSNELRLKPFSNEQQTVDSFLVKVLPTTRLRHYHDFYSNCVHHFELVEPHRTLTIESHLRVTTHALSWLPCDARPASTDRLKEAMKVERCYDFTQVSRYVDDSPETWRLAVDATQGEHDLWQQAVAADGIRPFPPCV